MKTIHGLPAEFVVLAFAPFVGLLLAMLLQNWLPVIFGMLLIPAFIIAREFYKLAG